MEERVEENRRPIGYWLKHLDRLIEDTFERTLSMEGLTRRHWQVLNTLERTIPPLLQLSHRVKR
jgi:hypothetical protein